MLTTLSSFSLSVRLTSVKAFFNYNTLDIKYHPGYLLISYHSTLQLLVLKQQLSKITTTDHSSLTTTTLLAILVLYLMNIFVSRHKSGLSLNHAFPTSVIFVAFDLTSTMKRPASVPALLYTLNLVTVTLCTITFHITR